MDGGREHSFDFFVLLFWDCKKLMEIMVEWILSYLHTMYVRYRSIV